MTDATAPPRRMPVRVAHVELTDEFDGAYRGWWADLQVNVTQNTLLELTAPWERRKVALSALVVAWNWVDRDGQPIDSKDPTIWDATVPTELIETLADRYGDEFRRLTAVPKVSPAPSATS